MRKGNDWGCGTSGGHGRGGRGACHRPGNHTRQVADTLLAGGNRLTLDGQALAGNAIPLVDDHPDHAVELQVRLMLRAEPASLLR